MGLEPGGTWLACGQGVPPAGAKRRRGMAVLLPVKTARRGSEGFRLTAPWNVPPGKTYSPSPPSWTTDSQDLTAHVELLESE